MTTTTIIKHGNTIRIYKCDKCGCIFIKNKREMEDLGYGKFLCCPECTSLIYKADFSNSQEIDEK